MSNLANAPAKSSTIGLPNRCILDRIKAAKKAIAITQVNIPTSVFNQRYSRFLILRNRTVSAADSSKANTRANPQASWEKLPGDSIISERVADGKVQPKVVYVTRRMAREGQGSFFTFHC